MNWYMEGSSRTSKGAKLQVNKNTSLRGKEDLEGGRKKTIGDHEWGRRHHSEYEFR